MKRLNSILLNTEIHDLAVVVAASSDPGSRRTQVAKLSVPKYYRDNIAAGIVHLGVGAFHRAHQAYYTEAVLNTEGGDWGIIGASLRSPSVKNQLAEQDGLYTLVEKGPDGDAYQIIGAVKDVIVGPEDPAYLIQRMARPEIKIVSLTITEKGYCHDPATGDINFDHPDIKHDLANRHAPKSAIGYIVAALEERMLCGEKSFTVLSCDNLPSNGRVLERVVKQFASRCSSPLFAWISANTTFPSTMIDRIVPATTESDKRILTEALGYQDEGAVIAEPFTQWVIEDKFCNGRPAWEKVGVELTDNVEVFEKIKLRLLNGSHSILAYCGYLSGYETISDVMDDSAFKNMITIFMDREAGQTITAPKEFDIAQYKKQLCDRFSNPGLKHRTWQIAMDGSQKIPQRWLETLVEQLKGRANIDILCLGLAAWFYYVSGENKSGERTDVQDPLAQRFREIFEKSGTDVPKYVREMLGVKAVFGAHLKHDTRLVYGVVQWLQKFCELGVKATIHKYYG